MSSAFQPRAGDFVTVRTAAEILQTLDDEVAVGGLPFMEEMLPYLGRTFRVGARAEKVCDTTHGTMNRHLANTVLLEDLRCDGTGHGGCQAGCRLLWRSSWLEPAESSKPTGIGTAGDENDQRAQTELKRRASLAARTRASVDERELEVYRCQATQLVAASEPFAPAGEMKYRLYLRELQSGNVGIRRFLRVFVRALILKIGLASGLRSRFPLRPRGPGGAAGALHLQPGELVRVKSRRQIAATLDENGKNRGLVFAWEMIPYCGGVYRIRDRVDRIINERTGEMINLTSDCVILEGVACTGDWSGGRWFCPRGIYPYWREAWLERLEEPFADGSRGRN